MSKGLVSTTFRKVHLVRLQKTAFILLNLFFKFVTVCGKWGAVLMRGVLRVGMRAVKYFFYGQGLTVMLLRVLIRLSTTTRAGKFCALTIHLLEPVCTQTEGRLLTKRDILWVYLHVSGALRKRDYSHRLG